MTDTPPSDRGSVEYARQVAEQTKRDFPKVLAALADGPVSDFTDEDVEAAARAAYETVGPFKWDTDVRDAYPDIADAYREQSRNVLAAVLPAYTARVLAEADERHADGYCCCGCSMTPEHDKRVRAEALREAADELALWLHEVNMPDDVITATCTWLRLRARADAEEGK